MSPDDIKHFLITFDPDTGETSVQRFGTDYDAAQAAYAEAEQAIGLEPKLDIVLLSADSLQTIEQTHSSYFNGGDTRLEELLGQLGPAALSRRGAPASLPNAALRHRR